eukprot:365148-Chlamydomonas_euryale.AAC.15
MPLSITYTTASSGSSPVAMVARAARAEITPDVQDNAEAWGVVHDHRIARCLPSVDATLHHIHNSVFRQKAGGHGCARSPRRDHARRAVEHNYFVRGEGLHSSLNQVGVVKVDHRDVLCSLNVALDVLAERAHVNDVHVVVLDLDVNYSLELLGRDNAEAWGVVHDQRVIRVHPGHEAILKVDQQNVHRQQAAAQCQRSRAEARNAHGAVEHQRLVGGEHGDGVIEHVSVFEHGQRDVDSAHDVAGIKRLCRAHVDDVRKVEHHAFLVQGIEIVS